MLLRDKTALITGASRGIGLAVAEAFVRHGASVILTARSESVHALASKLCRSGQTATAVSGDLKEDATVRECIKVCRAQHGKLDILVNNAGAMPQSLLGMIRMEDARQLFELNVLALVNLTQLASRLLTTGGSIINISSIAWSTNATRAV